MMKMDKSTWLAKEIIFALMIKMEKRTLQWSVMLPLVCTWNPWGPGVRPKTWDGGLSFNGAGDGRAKGDSGRGGDGGDDYDGGRGEDGGYD